jgi:hypothetical protein
MSNSAFTPIVLTVPSSGSSSTGQGELNIVTNPSAATDLSGWLSSGLTTTRDSSGSPLDPTVPTGLNISASATAQTLTSSNLSVPETLRNKKLKLEFYYKQISGSSFTVDILDGTSTPYNLSTDSSAGVTTLANTTGKFTCYFDTNSTSSLRVQLTSTGAGVTKVTQIIVGPGIQPQGAVVEAKKTITFTLGSFHASSTQSFNYNRSGEYMDVVGTIRHGGATTGVSLNLQFPAGLTANYDDWTIGSVGDNQYQVVGSVMGFSSAASKYFNGNICRQTTSNTGFQIFGEGAVHGNFVDWGNTGPITWAAGDTISVWMRVRINEWVGSGTVNVAQNDVEYVSHNGTTTVYGPTGSLIPTITASAVTTTTTHNIQFQTPIQPSDTFIIEYKRADVNYWTPISDSGSDGYSTLVVQNAGANRWYGIGIARDITDPRKINVEFGNAGARMEGNGYAQVGSNFPRTAGDMYRVRKSSAGAAVGFGIADTDSSGLVPSGTYNKSTGNWTFGTGVSNSITLTNNGFITSSTSDGSDNKSLILSGGGGGTAWTQNRGAGIVMQGNEVSGAEGELVYYAGNAGGTFSRHRWFAGGVDVGICSRLGAWTLGPTDNASNSNYIYGLTILKQGGAGGGSSAQNTVYVVKNTAAGNTNGDVYVTFHSAGNTGSTNFDIRSNGTGGAFSPVSDQRLKENINDLPSVLPLLTALRPVQFCWKGRADIQEGFIAQELQQVFPEDVQENKEGYLQVTGWGKTEARFVKAIQELATHNETLQTKVQEQQALIDSMLERLTALENK